MDTLHLSFPEALETVVRETPLGTEFVYLAYSVDLGKIPAISSLAMWAPRSSTEFVSTPRKRIAIPIIRVMERRDAENHS